MTSKDDVIRMARKAGFKTHHNPDLYDCMVASDKAIERFAELVIKPWADQLEVERKRFQELNDVVATGMQHARAAEREACARIAEYKLDNKGLTAPNSPKEWWNHACQNIRDAIRARGDI